MFTKGRDTTFIAGAEHHLDHRPRIAPDNAPQRSVAHLVARSDENQARNVLGVSEICRHRHRPACAVPHHRQRRACNSYLFHEPRKRICGRSKPHICKPVCSNARGPPRRVRTRGNPLPQASRSAGSTFRSWRTSRESAEPASRLSGPGRDKKFFFLLQYRLSANEYAPTNPLP